MTTPESIQPSGERPGHARDLATILNEIAYQLRDASSGIGSVEELVAVVSQITDVAGRLAGVYDQLSEWSWANGCPAHHATEHLLIAGDTLRTAGDHCRYAHSTLIDALDTYPRRRARS